MEPVRLGVIGCGVIGRVHLSTAQQSTFVEVVAVADVREQAAREAATQFGIATVYASADDLLGDPRVEAVVLAFPAAGRMELGLRALAAGKHLLIEKPVALNAGEVRRLIAARGNLVAGCCSSRFRQLDSAKATASFIATGALGDIRTLFCRVFSPAGAAPVQPPPVWRLSRSINGGGVLMNWGCYDLDFLLGITGWTLRPETVLAHVWPVPAQFESHVAPGSDAETHATALIRCVSEVTASGALISYERAEYAAAHREESWQVVGSRGTLRLQMTPGVAKCVVFDDGSVGNAATQQDTNTRVIWSGDEDYDAVNRAVLDDFALAVREGRAPMTSLEQALIVQSITDAIYASASSGKAVEIH